MPAAQLTLILCGHICIRSELYTRLDCDYPVPRQPQWKTKPVLFQGHAASLIDARSCHAEACLLQR